MKLNALAAAAIVAAFPCAAFSEDTEGGAHAMWFDTDGGECDLESPYAYFDIEGSIEVETGNRYVGDGSFYIPDSDETKVRKDGVVVFKAVSDMDGRNVTWYVDPKGAFTQEDYDLKTLWEEGIVDAVQLTPCER